MCDKDSCDRKLHFNSKVIPHSCAELDIHGIASTDGGDVLLCDVNNRCVLKYSSTGKFDHSCKFEHYPRDIVILQDIHQAVVTLQESRFSRKPGFIAFIDIISMKLLREVKLECTPYGIAISGSCIAVGSWNMIHLYDFNGALVKSLDLQHDRIAVKFIETNREGKLIYASSTLNCIKTDGEVVFKVHFDDGTPGGICVDDKNYIYVPCSHGQLLRISENGGINERLLNGDEGYGPLNAVCFNKDFTKLYVASNDGSSLLAFDFK